jgi:hypothetical protein
MLRRVVSPTRFVSYACVDVIGYNGRNFSKDEKRRSAAPYQCKGQSLNTYTSVLNDVILGVWAVCRTMLGFSQSKTNDTVDKKWSSSMELSWSGEPAE